MICIPSEPLLAAAAETQPADEKQGPGQLRKLECLMLRAVVVESKLADSGRNMDTAPVRRWIRFDCMPHTARTVPSTLTF